MSLLVLAGLAVMAPVQAQDQSNLVSSNATGNIYINQLLGVTRFYQEGYFGSRAVAANVEAGHAWQGHNTLNRVSQFIHHADAVGDSQSHATSATHAMAGFGNTQMSIGVARDSTLWSGAIAVSYGSGGSFNTSNRSFITPYERMLRTGINGRLSDVINSSWGWTNATGYQNRNLAIDGLIRESRRTVVASAGNRGADGPNSVGGLASGFNVVSVGALGPGNSSNPYVSRASFSSYGPNNYAGPDGTASGVRARVDLVAPGQALRLATNSGANTFSGSSSGTSFSAPIVAGGFALLADVGYDRFGGGNSVDSRVLKSVMQTSADKLPGWNNGQQMSGGVLQTSQALDWELGAGRMNMDRAFDVFTAGTTDVVGLQGGSIREMGWDYGAVARDGANDYFFNAPLLGGTTVTATLNWFVGHTYNGLTTNGNLSVSADYFTKLALEFYTVTNGMLDRLIATSTAQFINTQHLHFALDETGDYAIRVRWDGMRYGSVPEEFYALSWRGTAADPIPEPATMAVLGLGAGLLAARRRRKRS